MLLIANLGLLGWLLSADRAPAAKVVVATPDTGVNTISLVSEMDAAELEASATPEERPRPRAPAGNDEVVAPLCTLVGPFEEAFQGEDVVRRLQALQVDAELRDVEMQGQMRYWVYLAPLSSTRDAFRKLRELQAAGIDSYVIPKGSLENGISFGIFSELERAQSLTRELQARGFAAEYREEPQTYLERWVVLSGSEPVSGATAGSAVGEAFWQQLQLDYPDIGRRQNLCSEIQQGDTPQ
ncbi:SPOR domain-containing protein [Microbulbifer sp. HZ11]|uniref:SPOR domain-containing protein n=1 Tax=unclassified Microbulbifer TaxID=2619833 RepID=UPI001E376664|nr:hypothetical protein [Microbulbifer sp. HZ11]